MKSVFATLWNRKYPLSVAAGIMLGLSYPPFPFPFLMFPAFVLVFRLTSLSSNKRETAYYTFIAFLIWNSIATYWLTFATVAGGIAAILANAAIMTLPFIAVWQILKSGRHYLLIALSAASVWTLYEFLHYRWDLAWPWLSAANAFSNAILIVQYISYTGSLGITFWILFVSCLIYLFLSHQKRGILRSAAIVGVLPMLVSVVMYYSYRDNPDYTFQIVVAQPNHDSYLELSGFQNTFDPLVEILELSETVLTDSTRLVLWPENALMSGVHHGRPGTNDRYILNRVYLWNVPLITGAGYYRYYDPGEEPSVFRQHESSLPFNVYNAAVMYTPGGDIRHYGKGKLVPIVERFPFVEQLQYLPIPGVDWGGISGFGRGNSPTVFDADGTIIPAVICYDSVFPDWVRRFVIQGAGLITVITNDGWWGNTSGHIQHYDFARLRAIENRRSVVRSANNGISGMILANGDVHSKTTYWTQDVLLLDVPVYSDFTFYTRYGDLIGYFCLLALIPGLIRRKNLAALS
jgi:apolipoprotein N-acyltransferase